MDPGALVRAENGSRLPRAGMVVPSVEEAYQDAFRASFLRRFGLKARTRCAWAGLTAGGRALTDFYIPSRDWAFELIRDDYRHLTASGKLGATRSALRTRLKCCA